MFLQVSFVRRTLIGLSTECFSVEVAEDIREFVQGQIDGCC